MTLPPASEAQTEAAISDLFLRAGFYAVKTDAALVTRGSRRRVKSGSIPTGFPDMTYLLGLPGTGLCLAAVIETKTATGQLRDSQVERHTELRDLYGITPHLIRDAREAAALIAMARRIVGALKGAGL